MKPRDPNKSESIRVAESMSADDDEAAEIVFPTCEVPTAGANCRGSASTNPMVRDPGLVIEMAQVGRYSSANRRSPSCSILLLRETITGEAKASADEARVIDCVLDYPHASPPSLYILGQASGSL